MTKPVFVDRHVLQATADALTDLAGDLAALLAAADGLGVGAEVAQLRAAPTWASETALDLRARIGLVERLEHGNTAFASFTVSADEVRQMAGGSMPVEEQLDALEAAERSAQVGHHSGLPGWGGSQSFSDWIGEVEAGALARLPLLEGQGELIRQGLRAFEEHQALGGAGAPARRPGGTVLHAEWLSKGIAAVDHLYQGGGRTLYAPGYAPGDAYGDAYGDAADAVGETLAGLEAVKDSKLNPGNWF